MDFLRQTSNLETNQYHYAKQKTKLATLLADPLMDSSYTASANSSRTIRFSIYMGGNFVGISCFLIGVMFLFRTFSLLLVCIWTMVLEVGVV